MYNNNNLTFLEKTSNYFTPEHTSRNNFKASDVESTFTSISQIKKEVSNKNSFNLGFLKQTKTTFKNVKKDLINEPLSSITKTKWFTSNNSFSTLYNTEKQDLNLNDFNKKWEDHSRPLRIFNKNGKPLTDRFGRPLYNILGQALIIFNDSGRLVSDGKGKQVFNSRGESAIYSTTNLCVPPAREDSGIPIMDIDKKHIICLFDNKGHPLTDCSGRPLVKASGNLMLGMFPGEKTNINDFKDYELKTIYARAPLENFVRRVQILDSNSKALTDENGMLLQGAKIICNKHGMPMCDKEGRQLLYKYGSRIATQIENFKTNAKTTTGVESDSDISSGTSGSSLVDTDFFSELRLPSFYGEDPQDVETTTAKTDTSKEVMYEEQKTMTIETAKLCTVSSVNASNSNGFASAVLPEKGATYKNCFTMTNKNSFGNLTENVTVDARELSNQFDQTKQQFKENVVKKNNSKTNLSHYFEPCVYNRKTILNPKTEVKRHIKFGKHTGEAMILFDATNKIHSKNSLSNSIDPNNQTRYVSHNMRRKTNRRKFHKSSTPCILQYFKDVFPFSKFGLFDSTPMYNDYGKPMKDLCGNAIYDKFGIPLTGANGLNLSEKARYALRLKLRNIPVVPLENTKLTEEIKLQTLPLGKSCDDFGEPLYDKHGRPLYDLFGKLNYDIFGRPLTDAFGRPLIDAIGQPLMDSKGNVLTSNSLADFGYMDVFGRVIYDKKGRELFDAYGRPRFDIFTNAIYGNCGRPVSDAHGNAMFDFMNQPIKPYPPKPLVKNVKALLPGYINKILETPSIYRVVKYSPASLKDVFGGPLFDDFGRPLYNNIGKPLYDKYGRPLYDKDGKPLCDPYGLPLSEEIRLRPDDVYQVSSVVDSLKLLRLTKESSQWMEMRRSKTSSRYTSSSGNIDGAMGMKILQPSKNKSILYTYALTRVTVFKYGRQALEILEAPLSASTAAKIRHLPIDNKPLIMKAERRQRFVRNYKNVKNISFLSNWKAKRAD